MARSFRALTVLALLAGCARTPAPVAVAPPPLPVASVPMPAGASPNMQIPAALADGRYPTPNDGISPSAALWHLRAALNVAALACPGDSIAKHYNALLSDRRAAFAGAQKALAAEYRKASATDWQDAWDDSMTRLYNYYALAPARAGFCAAADRVLAAPPADLIGRAPAALTELDRPFTDFFAAYDAWRDAKTVAMVSPVPAGRIPVLKVDPAIFR